MYSGSKPHIGFVSTAMKDCLSKLITLKEAPVKAKYFREIIMLTSTEHGAAGFWNWMEGKQSIQNYIMCWKFCFVLHKIINEGNSKVIVEAQTRLEFFCSFSKLWNDQLKASKGNYDALISYYSGLLIVKLRFHQLYPNIRVNLEMSEQEFYKMLDACYNAGKDPKILCSELLHYWDFVMTFLNTMHLVIPEFSSDPSSNVQCKLQPFCICLNECTNLYSFSKSLLFQLHADLEPDSLQLLKIKFDNLFKRLQDFKSHSKSWPRDTSLVDLNLPNDPPKFDMVHNTKYCPIQQTHFHGALLDNDNLNTNISWLIPEATAPQYFTTLNTNTNTNVLSPTNPYEIRQVLNPIHISPLTPTTAKSPAANINSNEHIMLMELRIIGLEEENRTLKQKVQYLETTNANVRSSPPTSPIPNENIESVPEMERLKEELKQLKVNSGQQFLQLYSKIREKDELLSQMQVEKNQYELLAQMNLKRLQLELQNEQSD